MMADIQEWFIEQEVRNFYSVSISGYHIAEAGANPISQLAFTLANGFTYVESYLARGMDIDDFAPNLSFFFSNGMDPEYSVLGRVARRIWAVAMKEKYGADERSQKLKYHVQTSGRSLHAQEMDFNDIRTTLQALIAIYDNANSLHTNAYDEAVTTPSEESVRRALAIQLIINREWGLAMNENPLQGSFIIDELTDLVEEAVLARVRPRSTSAAACSARWRPATSAAGSRTSRCSTSTASTTARCRSSASTPSASPDADDGTPADVELARATEDEKESQLRRVRDFQAAHRDEAAAGAGPAQGRRDHRRERLRRADGRRPGLLAAAGHRGVLRGRRAVPPQRLSPAARGPCGPQASRAASRLAFMWAIACDRDHRVDARGGREGGGVRDDEVADLPGRAVRVERRGRRVAAHPDRAHQVQRGHRAPARPVAGGQCLGGERLDAAPPARLEAGPGLVAGEDRARPGGLDDPGRAHDPVVQVRAVARGEPVVHHRLAVPADLDLRRSRGRG